jgi:mannose-6-phosphate isomerase
MSRLAIRTVEKPWGREALPAPFVAPEGQRIGEIWFQPPPELPQLLVKYIFTSEKLSVQVHPDDDQARAAGHGRNGKEECWLVIDAEPGATLGVGFREPLGRAAMRAAALDGSIEELLAWHPVAAGDFFYIPAGTVHAIGAGVSLIEVQQNADITYRLYDYGRPRELHLDAGVAVARAQFGWPTAAISRSTVSMDRQMMTCGRHMMVQ